MTAHRIGDPQRWLPRLVSLFPRDRTLYTHAGLFYICQWLQNISALLCLPAGSILMPKALRDVFSFAWNNLGNCSHCIRSAFRAAVAGWFLSFVILILGWVSVLPLSIAVSLALTALWLAHIVVHTRKATLASSNSQLDSSAVMSRRAVFPLFLRALCAAAAMSVMPAFAQQPCPNGTGGCGNDGCSDCYRPCYGNDARPCVYCRSCGSDCGDNTC